MVDRASASTNTKLFLSNSPSIVYPRAQVRREGGVLNLPESQAAISNSRDTLNIYNASTVPSTFLQGSSTLQINVPPSTVFLKHLRFEFTVTNSGANPVKLLPVPLWFASIEIRGNGGNTTIQQWTSASNLYLSQFMNVTDEKLMAIGPALNINPSNPGDQAPGASVPAGATVKFYMDLADACYEQTPLWLGDIKGDLQFHFNSSPNTAFDVTAGGGTIASITLTSCRALATVVIPTAEQTAYMATQTVRDNQFLNQTTTSTQMTLSAGVKYPIRLSASQGLCPWLIVTTRGPLPFASPAAARDWPDITKSFRMLDSAGLPIMDVDEQYASSFLAADYWQGCQAFVQLGGVTQWSFSSAPGYVEQTGAVLGGYYLTSSEQYEFTTEAGMTPGTYEISITCPVYSILRIENGSFSVYKS